MTFDCVVRMMKNKQFVTFVQSALSVFLLDNQNFY